MDFSFVRFTCTKEACMKIDVQFVNFPKSDMVRQIVGERIADCVDKFSPRVTSVKAFFSLDGLDNHVKIAVRAARLDTCITASSTDIAHAIDKAMTKLETLLRKLSAKNKDHKMHFHYMPHTNASSSIPLSARLNKHSSQAGAFENEFDKYENQYQNEFDDRADLKEFKDVS
jgi:ribosomal subunit interface protein